jgi:hypothetical protein
MPILLYADLALLFIQVALVDLGHSSGYRAFDWQSILSWTPCFSLIRLVVH